MTRSSISATPIGPDTRTTSNVVSPGHGRDGKDPSYAGRPLVWGRGGTGAAAVQGLYRHLNAVLHLGASDARPIWVMAPDADAFAAALRRLVPGHETPDVVIATSGSSDGRGHLVGLTLAALAASASATLARLGGPGQWVTSLPVHAVAGFQVVLRSALAGVAPRVYAPASGFDESLLARALAGADPTRRYLSLVPTQLHAALAAGTDLLRRFDAVLVGGAALPPELAARAAAAEVQVVTTYGSTETSGGCVYDGVPLAGVGVRLVGESGGGKVERGRIQIAGPMLAQGYLDLPPGAAAQPFVTEADTEIGQTIPVRRFPERWLSTPDVGRFDSGRLVIEGRADEVLISGGANVSPQLVERALSALGGEWLVVGVPDPRWGQLVTAVTTCPDADLPGIRAATAGLCRAERPRAVVRVEALPLRPTGKPDRRAALRLATTLLAKGAGERSA